MNSLRFWFHRAPGATGHFHRTLLLAGPLLIGALGSAPAASGAASGSPFTYGTYISESYYDGGVAFGSFATPGGFNYDNEYSTQTNTRSDPAPPYSSATSTASLLPSNQLSLSLSGSNTYTFTAATAELWDTLSFAGVPAGPGPGILVATLNMSGNASVGAAPFGVNASSAWGLDIFNPSTSFANAGSNCGLVYSYYACGVGYIDQSSSGVILPNGNPTATFAPGPFNFSYNIYSDFLTNGQLSFIETIALRSSSDASLTIDPTITVTGLYPGVTVTSASGANYGALAVPEPATWAMLLGGFGGLGAAMRSRRKKVAAAALATQLTF